VKHFHDAKSKAQIAAFKLRESHAARWRNAKNLERWNDACRDRWEVEAVGAPAVRPTLDFDELPA
jgi:hypothetical protein